MKPIQVALMVELCETKQLTTTSNSSGMITSQFTHPKQFEESAADMRYDVIVVDITQDEFSHIDTIQLLSDIAPHAKIIVICPYPDGELADALIHMGATGILLRDEFFGDRAHFIRAVYTNRFVISPGVLRAFLAIRDPHS